MVDIVKRGPDKDRKVRTECRECESTLEFLPEDPKVRLQHDDRDGDYHELNCPVCGAKVTKAVAA